MTAEIKHVPGDDCAACAAVVDYANQLRSPGFTIPMPPASGVPEAPQWARDLAAHMTADIHEIIRLLSGLESRISAAAADIAAARGDILELAGKLDGLEQEFGPLARKFSTTAGRLSATGAAAFTRRRANNDRGTI